MTEPTTGTQDVSAISASAQAVVDNAARLGVSWVLRIATVQQPTPPKVIYDGDTIAIGVTSMVGSVAAGQRVYVIQVPPSGNFIVGLVNGPFFTRTTVSATTLSVTFTIPSRLRRVSVYWTARSDGALGLTDVRMQINNSGAIVYTGEQTTGNAATTTSASFGTSSAFVGHIPGATAGAGIYGTSAIDFVGWDAPHPSYLGWVFVNQTIVAGAIVNVGGGSANINGPYTSLTFTPGTGSFVSGSDFQVEGIPS